MLYNTGAPVHVTKSYGCIFSVTVEHNIESPTKNSSRVASLIPGYKS